LQWNVTLSELAAASSIPQGGIDLNAPLALLVALFFMTSVYSSLARAEVGEGRLVFSGAVVEPTCSVSTEETLAAGRESGARPAVNRMTCASQSDNQAHASAVYSSVALRLSSTETDVVLKYFDAYVKADRPDALDPMLVTHVYE